MSKPSHTLKKVKIVNLIHFCQIQSQVYQGARLNQLANSMNDIGLQVPIIVREIEKDRYEILSGHNRVEAARLLKWDSIKADIRQGLSDEEALRIFYDTNLNQQNFSDWNYTNRLAAVKYAEKIMKETSQQGKRTDLEHRKSTLVEETTSVQNRQKLTDEEKPKNTRDKMAKKLGISTATFSKYRSIAKLPDNTADVIAKLLDENRISLDIAYKLSRLESSITELCLSLLNTYTDKKVNLKSFAMLFKTYKDYDNSKPIEELDIQNNLFGENLIPPIRSLHE